MVRLKTKWHRSKRSERNKAGSNKPKQLKDLSSVIAMNIWKLAKEAFAHMEKEGFRFRDDEQAIGSINEFMVYQLHIVDRMIYTKVSEDERGPFINAVAGNLIETMVENQAELLGPGEYQSSMVDFMNQRLSQYAECDFTDEGPSYEFTRYLALNVSEHLEQTDSKWVVEQVIDIEAPPIIEKIMRVAEDVLGLRFRG
ncbi:MAG: hypothetical protein OEZ68_12655 [Gammaproteobacteria bacterium]|nr:hypothetical protein [Gammaproteobacteria bacterium]MDH5801647.1 hypothetical protein [Gammaproteobacteria bacterium]